MANVDVPTVNPVGDGLVLLYGAIILLVLSWTFFLARLGVRIWKKAWGMDDYFMSVGIVLFTVTASLCIVCCYYGSGQFSAVLPPLTMAKGVKLFYIAEYFYAVSAMFIKISVAVTLLRIASGQRPIEWALWLIIGATIIAAIVFCVGIANICHPISTLWGEATGKCNLQLNTNVSLFFSAVEIATDFSLSILPAILLWNVQMKGKVKALVAVMLGLASFASCATLVRLKFLTLYSDPGEFMYGTGKIGFWSLTEEGIGIIAGSMPALRPLLSIRIRITTGSSKTPGGASGSAYPPQSFHSRNTPSRPGIMMDTFQVLNDHDEPESDGDSQRKIVVETKYSVTSSKMDTPKGVQGLPR
ncbi:hypothetical protein BU24DRAFT_161861 [Aaosphaeria arxii CBS 175.79]|uniref:Rhodopsin domain-containing protein n=1 Tax=Aaosphaeria arxii CBS 175.79 TaxID=1450172 RepID=A0A6A5XY97_9PLEO|nr:uncharacterized protein BU24DRAFT_161861 [Aaosphaeria arxii CBS 175.79]KAF2017903.1 hypothetical protein BU24DRAFT_161861 [Aaosphaeria arxii CBS 175.79]